MSLFQCPLDKTKVVRLFNMVILIGLLVLLLTVAAYCSLGFFSRYLADDYCFSNQIVNKGLLNGLAFFYQNISNRFGAFLFVLLSELFGEKAIQIIPGLMLVFLLFSLFIAFKWFFHLVKLNDSTMIILLISALTVFLVLFQAPNLFQSIYWRSGVASYFAPLPFFFISLGIILRQLQLPVNPKRQWIWTFFVFVLTIFSGGMSETFAAFQTTFWLLLLAGWILSRRKINFGQLSILNISAVLGSMMAMVVMVLAPGNQLRLNVLPQAGSVWTVLQLSFRYAFDFIWETLRGLPIPTFFTLLTPALFAYHLTHDKPDLIHDNKMIWVLFIIPIVAFLLIASVCAPTAYGMLAYPEPRALIIARLALTLSFIVWGGVFGILSHLLMDRVINICFASILILGILWLYPLRNMVQVWQQIPAWQARAIAWDVRRADIGRQKSQGFQMVKVNALDSIAGVAELSSDPQFWVNQCAAGYYGLQSIQAVNDTQ